MQVLIRIVILHKSMRRMIWEFGLKIDRYRWCKVNQKKNSIRNFNNIVFQDITHSWIFSITGFSFPVHLLILFHFRSIQSFMTLSAQAVNLISIYTLVPLAYSSIFMDLSILCIKSSTFIFLPWTSPLHFKITCLTVHLIYFCEIKLAFQMYHIPNSTFWFYLLTPVPPTVFTISVDNYSWVSSCSGQTALESFLFPLSHTSHSCLSKAHCFFLTSNLCLLSMSLLPLCSNPTSFFI